MIDLDALESTEDNEQQEFELYCRFGVLLVSGRISYQDWCTLVKVFNIHHYVLPDERTLIEELLDTIYHAHKKSSAMLLWHSLLMGHIECHFTETHQVRILALLIRKGRC